MSTEEHVSKVSKRLASSSDHQVILDNLKTLFTLLSEPSNKKYKQNVETILKTVSLQSLFDCFKFATEQLGDEIANTTYYVVSKLLNEQEVSSLIINNEKLCSYFVAGFKHPNPLVRSLVVQQISRLTDSEEQVKYLLGTSHGLIQLVVAAYKDQNLSVVKEATVVLQTIAKKHVPIFISSNIFKTLQDQMMDNDVNRMRLYELASHLMCLKSPDIQDYLIKIGILECMVKELDTDNDVNLLNILEIIQQASKNTIALQYLQKLDTFSKILTILLKKKDDAVLCSFILHFVADFAANAGDLALSVVKADQIFQQIGEMLNSKETNARETAIVVLSKLATKTNTGLKTLLGTKTILGAYLKCLSHSEISLVVTFFHSLGEIFESKMNGEEDLKPLALQVQNFIKTEYGTGLVEKLMNWLKQPFSELRFSIFHFMKGFARFFFGAEDLCNYPLFVDYLINRDTESTKAGREWKYGVAQEIFAILYQKETPSQPILDAMVKSKLKVFLNQGPHYIASDAAVMVGTLSK